MRGFDWQTLKRISNAKLSWTLALLTFATPIYASAIAFSKIKYGIELPKPTNLFLLYLASILHSISGYAYALFCPRVIRDYESKYTFIDRCVSQSYAFSLYFDNLEKKQKDIIASIRGDEEIDDRDTTSNIYKLAQYENELTNSLPALKDIWENENSRTPALRSTITTLYLAAFSIIAYLTLWDAPAKVLSAMRS